MRAGVSESKLNIVRDEVAQEISEKKRAAYRFLWGFLFAIPLLAIAAKPSDTLVGFVGTVSDCAPHLKIIVLRYCFEVWFCAFDNLQDEARPVSRLPALFATGVLAMSSALVVVASSTLYQIVAFRILLSCFLAKTADSTLWKAFGLAVSIFLFWAIAAGPQSPYPDRGSVPTHVLFLAITISTIASCFYEAATRKGNPFHAPQWIVEFAYQRGFQILGGAIGMAFGVPVVYFVQIFADSFWNISAKLVLHSAVLLCLSPARTHRRELRTGLLGRLGRGGLERKELARPSEYGLP